MTIKAGGMAAVAKLEATGGTSFSHSHGNVDLRLAHQEAIALKMGRPGIPANATTHHCPHAGCIANVMGWCGEAKEPDADANRHVSSAQKAQTIPRHRMIFHPKEWCDFVPIICDGWAAYSIVGADGRRQILSFRLPGDIICTAWLYDAMSERTVEAITPVIYRKFERRNFMKVLFNGSGLPEKLIKVLSNELAQAERVAYNVGRRRADERIARLIVGLSERLAKYGMMQGQTMEFPLRQRDIADATGLTHDHVSKVLGNFQRANLIKISGQSLTIIDQPELCSRALRPFH